LYHNKIFFSDMRKRIKLSIFLFFGILLSTSLPSTIHSQPSLHNRQNEKIVAPSLAPSVSVEVQWLNGTVWDSANVVVDRLLIIGKDSNSGGDPNGYFLSQNYPNPFNPETNIQYLLTKPSFVTIKIFNALGQEITTLFQGNKPAGDDTILWNGCDWSGNPVASGIYFYQIEIGQFTQSRKMLLLR